SRRSTTNFLFEQAPMAMLRSALALAHRGMAVFALSPGSKLPIVGSHGFKDATTDPAIVTKWWQEDPQRNIGIATGSPSGGVLVLDVDGLAAERALANLEQQHGAALGPTVEVVTPRAGRHIYLRTDRPVPCSAGRIAANVDVRCSGGYVVAPPS